MGRLGHVGRLRAGAVALIFLTLSGSGTKAQVETTITVISAVSSIASMFGPRGGTTEILLAVAQNLKAINESLQNITMELAELKKDVAALPDRIMQNELTVKITGRLQNTYTALSVLAQSKNDAAEISAYKDLKAYYDQARDFRADLFSSQTSVAERLAIQIPFLYGVELASFNSLNSIDLEDPKNSAVFGYFVHEDWWKQALLQYARFYRFSLDPQRQGSFANKLRQTEIDLRDEYAKVDPEFPDKISNSDDDIVTTSLCYYTVSPPRKINTGNSCDDRGCKVETTEVRYYSFSARSYAFELDRSNEIVSVTEYVRHLDYYDDLQRNPIDHFLQDYWEECSGKVVPAAAISSAYALASGAVNTIKLLIAKRDLLLELRNLGEVMEKQILAEMKLRELIDDDQEKNQTLKFPLQLLRKGAVQ